MITIGDFARLGRVSVRMLRHYDEIGLLRPAYTDPESGYRHYEVAQLAQLNRIIALKDLGFTLQQVQMILSEAPSVAELQGMLRLRRAELQARVAAEQERLARVQARLSIIEREGLMPKNEVIVKQIPAVRIAEMQAIASSYDPEDITPVISPLFDTLCSSLIAAGITPVGPTIAYYEPIDQGVLVHAACPVDPGLRSDSVGLDKSILFVDLPEIEAATLVHNGSMDRADSVVQELARWIEAHGYVGSGYAREVYLECTDDRDGWVTEFQEPVVAVAEGKV